MKRTLPLILIGIAGLVAVTSPQKSTAQSGCPVVSTGAPAGIGSVKAIVGIGKYASVTTANSESNSVLSVQRRQNSGDATYDGTDITNNAAPPGCFTTINETANVPRIAGPFADPLITDASTLRFVLYANEPSNGSSTLDSLSLKFYSNNCGQISLTPFLTTVIPAGCSLTKGYYVFNLNPEQATALQISLDDANNSSENNARGVYVGASISVGQDDATDPATTGEILYVGRTTDDCQAVLDSTSQTFHAGGGSGSFIINASSCLWDATTNSSWITINLDRPALGTQAVGYTVDPNPTGASRTGTITVGDQEFTVTQRCQTVSMSNPVFGSAGGIGSISITWNGCLWTLLTDQPWIHLPITTGQGSPTLQYMVDPNGTGSPRTGTITAAGFQFTVSQAGAGGSCQSTPISPGQTINGTISAGDCTSRLYTSINTDTYRFSGTAGQQVRLSLSSGSAFGIVFDPLGVQIADSFSGPFRLTMNGTYIIEVLSTSVPVNYSVSLCAFVFTPNYSTISSSGGSGSIKVAEQGGCQWTASTSTPGWVTVSSPVIDPNCDLATFTNCYIVNFTVAPNFDRTRFSSITIAGRSFQIAQQNNPSLCAVTHNSSDQTFGPGGGTGSVTVTGDVGCPWSATKSADASFVTFTSAESGSGNGLVTFAVAINSGPARSGTITVANKTFSVFQYGATATIGDLDFSFGFGGRAVTDFSGLSATASAIAIQPDGKIITVGSFGPVFHSDFAVARYNPDGSLDMSFGYGGKVTTDFYQFFQTPDSAHAVALQSDGKIVVAGTDGFDFALARYNPNGTLDTSFDADGKVRTDIFAGSTDIAYGVALQPDGKIVAAGSGQGQFVLVRYNPNGSLDTSFDSDGKVTTDFLANVDEAHAIAIQTNGKIVLAGYATHYTGFADLDFAVARYNANGGLDTSFDSDGKVTTNLGFSSDVAQALAIQSDDRIVVAGASGGDFEVLRYNTTGALDTTFDMDGKVTTDFLGDDGANALAIQTDGKIIAAGTGGNMVGFALARYNSTGALDASFGVNGKVTTSFGLSPSYALGVAIQTDGKIVAAGYSDYPTYRFALARYLSTNVSCAAPSISSPPATQTVCPGSSVTLSVSASGTGLNYQWRKGGAPVSGATSNSLTFNPVTAANSGGYDVVITGSCGTQTSSAATLTVTSVSIAPTSRSFSAAGGNGSVNVSTGASCSWSSVRSDTWITINSSSDIGNGTVNYSVAPNSTANSRSGSITIGEQTFAVLQGAAFLDVPSSYLFYEVIGKLSARGVTLGCGGGNYCPDASVTREQMAAFIIRALGMPNPPTPGSQRFADVPPSNPFYAFIEQMAIRGITVGCGTNGSGQPLYCPGALVTREQMAAFLIRAIGEFNPPPPGSQRFNDVPPANIFYAFIDRLALLEITLGCSASPPLYCPTDTVTRGQMAAFLVRAFHL